METHGDREGPASMAKSRRKTYKKRIVEVNLGELQGIVDASAERALTAEEHKKLAHSHQLLVDLILPELQSETSEALNGAKPGAKDGEKKEEPKERKPPAKNGGRRPRSDFKAAETVKLPHTQLKVGQLCPCGCGGRLYKWDRVGHFRYFEGQAPIKVTLYERELLKSNMCDNTYEAPLPEGVGPGHYDPTAVSTIAMNKYGVGVPFYRQEKQLEIMGTPVSSSTQYKVVSDGLAKVTPAYEYLLWLAAQGKLAHYDDTSMKILDFIRPKDDKRTGIFTTGLVSVHDDWEIALLFTGREHAGENRAKLLKNREPDLGAMILMSDALACNSVGLTDDDLMANCMAHGRRNFVKIIDFFPEECQRVIAAIGEVYYFDGQSQELGHTDEQRLAFHQERSGPVMESLKTWLDEQVKQKKTEPNSRLGKAIAYMRTHWPALTLFLRVPGAPLDNNLSERVLKNVVLHRKNSLFYRTAAGAKTGDIYMSLIQTCQRNGANPWDYLTELQRNHEAVKQAPEEWLPWNYKAAMEAKSAQPSASANPPPVADPAVSPPVPA